MNDFIDFTQIDECKFYMLKDDIMHDYRLNLEEVMLYTLLYRRCQLSAHGFIESGKDYTFSFWDNSKDTVYCIYTMDELEIKLRKKRNYISKCIKHLKELDYIETEIDRSVSNANRFYLKQNKKVLSTGNTKDFN